MYVTSATKCKTNWKINCFPQIRGRKVNFWRGSLIEFLTWGCSVHKITLSLLTLWTNPHLIFQNGENENERKEKKLSNWQISGTYIIEKFCNKFNWDVWNLENSICWIAIF